MEESPKKRKELFEGLSQGWYIGTKEGKMLLSEQVKQGKAQASAQAQLELVNEEGQQLLKSALKTLGKSDLDLETDQKSVRWKLALASWIKEQTSIKNKVLSEQLNMGHPATMSNHITAYRRTRQKRCEHYRKFRRLLKY